MRGPPYVQGSPHLSNSPGFHDPSQDLARRRRDPRRRRRPRNRSVSLPEWNLADLYPAMDAPEIKRDLDRGETECIEFEKAYKGRLADIAAERRRRPHAGRGGAALRGDRGRARPADLLCGAALRRQHHRSRHRQVLWRHAGAHHRGLAASVVLHARPEPPRRRRAGEGDGRSGARPLPALDRGHPQGQAVPARGPRRAAVPREVGDRLLRLQPAVRRDHGGAALQDRRQVAAARADAQPDAGRRPEEAQGRGRGAGQDLQGEPAAVHARHQHARQGQGDFRPLARLRRRRAIAPSRQPRRARGGGRAGVVGARGLSAAVAPLLRAEGEVVRQEAIAALGPQRAAAAGARCAPSPGRRRARHGADRLRRVLAEDGVDRRALLQRPLDRRAGAAGKIARRLRASDRAVGAPLCAAELPGQAARRDDARPRARPRRAPGAGRAERPADGADAADARRDRERVRRDADLQEAARPRPPTRSSARPCSPPRSRT